MDEIALFSREYLSVWLQGRRSHANKKLGDWDQDSLLTTPDYDIVEVLRDEFVVKIPVLDRDGIYALEKIEGSRIVRDSWGDDIRRDYVVRRFTIPFIGTAEVFFWRASQFSMNPHRGEPSRNGPCLVEN